MDNTAGGPLEEVLRRHPNLRRVVAGRNVGFAARLPPGRGGGAGAAARVRQRRRRRPARCPRPPRGAPSRTPAPDVVAAAGRLADVSGRKNDFSDGFLTFDGHAFQKDVGRPRRGASRAAPGRGAALRLRRPDVRAPGRVPRIGLRRRLLRLPRGRGLRLAPVDLRASDHRRAPGRGAAPRRRDRRGPRRLLPRVPDREERLRDRLQELRRGALPRPDAGASSPRS